jgi:hypothetical protein
MDPFKHLKEHHLASPLVNEKTDVPPPPPPPPLPLPVVPWATAVPAVIKDNDLALLKEPELQLSPPPPPPPSLPPFSSLLPPPSASVPIKPPVENKDNKSIKISSVLLAASTRSITSESSSESDLEKRYRNLIQNDRADFVDLDTDSGKDDPETMEKQLLEWIEKRWGYDVGNVCGLWSSARIGCSRKMQITYLYARAFDHAMKHVKLVNANRRNQIASLLKSTPGKNSKDLLVKKIDFWIKQHNRENFFCHDVPASELVEDPNNNDIPRLCQFYAQVLNLTELLYLNGWWMTWEQNEGMQIETDVKELGTDRHRLSHVCPFPQLLDARGTTRVQGCLLIGPVPPPINFNFFTSCFSK